ncbi:MAG: S-adenosylmethionine:tRNA ribosyltransferase-isomerase [Planctomycetota bacterium]|nr:S-adenosylmethionine:tRNA ribosyltransferase-isomerase [Planctomycetota bacterium]
MNIELFDFHLPEELIAQSPIEPRDESRLMVLERRSRGA